eukprot:350078-Chlamydomonas_euryale.AAC.1
MPGSGMFTPSDPRRLPRRYTSPHFHKIHTCRSEKRSTAGAGPEPGTSCGLPLPMRRWMMCAQSAKVWGRAGVCAQDVRCELASALGKPLPAGR